MESNIPVKHFAILGHPVAQSFSPVMHTASFRAIGFDADYVKLDVPPENLPAALADLTARGFQGLNLTIPHKEAALRLMDSLTPEAARAGAVNTVRINPDGTLAGHNTDGEGALEAIRSELGINPANTTACIVGCGGAGKAIAFALGCSGSKLILVNRTRERAEALAEKLHRLGIEASVAGDPIAAARASHLVVQCTPSGLPGHPAPALPPEAFYPGQAVYDAVIAPGDLLTPTLRAAQTNGARTANGIGMLVYQGAHSFTFWTGLQADRTAMRRAVETALTASQK